MVVSSLKNDPVQVGQSVPVHNTSGSVHYDQV